MGDWSDTEPGLGDYGGGDGGGGLEWSGDGDSGSGWNFDLDGNVGPREENDRQDVIKVETLLGNNDYLDLSETDGPTGYWGTRTEEAVRRYQDDNGLTVDGWLAPKGETLSSLQNDLGDFLSRAKPATPEQVDDHHERLSRGEDGTLNLKHHDFKLAPRDDLPEISAESEASNHRLAQAIHRSADFGHIPEYMADAVQTGGEKATAEIHDLFKRIGPDKADDLAQAVVEKLPAEHHEAFIGAPVSERQPLGVGYDILHKPTAEDIRKNPELGGGLGGEIEGMKRDAEEAKARAEAGDGLEGGSGTDKVSDKPWENHANPDFRAALAGAEQSANKPNHGYGEINERSKALGRYQFTDEGLKAAGWKIDGKWTDLAKQNGVNSNEEFLQKPEAQEKALTDYTTKVEREACQTGLFKNVGKTYTGVLGEKITVTEPGLMAALHRESQKDVGHYFEKLERLGGETNGQGSNLSDKDKTIETRLRTFQKATYSGTSAKR